MSSGGGRCGEIRVPPPTEAGTGTRGEAATPGRAPGRRSQQPDGYAMQLMRYTSCEIGTNLTHLELLAPHDPSGHGNDWRREEDLPSHDETQCLRAGTTSKTPPTGSSVQSQRQQPCHGGGGCEQPNRTPARIPSPPIQRLARELGRRDFVLGGYDCVCARGAVDLGCSGFAGSSRASIAAPSREMPRPNDCVCVLDIERERGNGVNADQSDRDP